MDVGDLAKYGYDPRHSNASRKASLQMAIGAKGVRWVSDRIVGLLKQGRYGRELSLDLRWLEGQR